MSVLPFSVTTEPSRRVTQSSGMSTREQADRGARLLMCMTL